MPPPKATWRRASRVTSSRSGSAKRLRARRELVAEILSQQKIGDLAWTSAMLLAMEDGFGLHRLVDPASIPADSFLRSLTQLLKLSRS
jgi:hypothetical protein